MKNQHSLSDSKSLLQNTRLLTQSVVSPIHVDASMTKSSRKRYAVNNHISRNTLDLGQFNDSKLSNLYQSSYEQQERGEVTCLAYIDKSNNKQLTINPNAIKLFKKYEKNQITFVGNFGKKGSGKSFWYDNILHLSQVQGAQYSKIQDNPGLYIWSVPFIKNNLRIFLIDYSNDKQGESPSGQDEKLFDLEAILSQILVLLPQPQDKKLRIADAAYTTFNSSMGRLSDKGSKSNKQTAYWPHSLYNLYRSVKAVSPQTDKLSYLFSDYNYSLIHNALNSKIKQSVPQLSLMESSIVKGQSSSRLLNQKYVKRTSLVFKDIYRKLMGKSYEGLNYTGELLPFILKHSVRNLNSTKNIKMDKMFNDIKREIYEGKLEAGKFVYNINYDILKASSSEQEKANNKSSSKIQTSKKQDQLKSSRNNQLNPSPNPLSTDKINKTTSQQSLLQSSSKGNAGGQIIKPKPIPLDNLIEIFRKTNQNVLHDYHQTKYDPIIHQEYQNKLIQYGQLKQKEVLQYNKKQTYNSLFSSLPTYTQPKQSTQLNSEAVIAYLASLKTSGLPLDHDRCNPVSQKLTDICFCAKKYKYFNVWQTENHYKQRKLQMAVQDKRKQLNDSKYNRNAVLLMNTHNQNEASQFFDEHNRSTQKIEKLKDQVELSKKRNNGISDEEYVAQLQKHKKKLENTIKLNQRKARDYNLTPSKDPRVSLLQQKLDDKKTMQLQVQSGLSNIGTSRLNNTSSILSSRRTQVRKIGDGGIKKSRLNKSMTK